MSDNELVYLICFKKRYKHAKHYVGWTTLDRFSARIRCHKQGKSFGLMKALKEAGIDIHVVRVWKGADRTFEARLKNVRKDTPSLCPVCRGESNDPKKLEKAIYKELA